MLKLADLTPICLGTWPGVIPPCGHSSLLATQFPSRPSPQGGLRRDGQQHSLNPAHSPMSLLLYVVATGPRARGRRSCRSGSLWAPGAPDQEAPEVVLDCSRSSRLGATWPVPGAKEERKAKSGADVHKAAGAAGRSTSLRLCGNVETSQGQWVILLPWGGGLWV